MDMTNRPVPLRRLSAPTMPMGMPKTTLTRKASPASFKVAPMSSANISATGRFSRRLTPKLPCESSRT